MAKQTNGENGLLERLVQEMQGLTPEFELWVKTMLFEDKLNLILEAVIQLGNAKDSAGALSFLGEESRRKNFSKIILAYCDLEGRHHGPFEMLKKIMGEDVGDSDQSHLYRIHGIKSHQAVPGYLCGEIPDYKNVERIKRSEFQSDPVYVQSFLFDQIAVSQSQDLFGDLSAEILAGNKISNELKRDILDQWRECLSIVNFRNWSENIAEIKMANLKLGNLLAPIFGPYIDDLRKYEGPFPEYLLFLTLMTWATVIPQPDYSGERVLFKEIPVLAHEQGIGKRRLDAIEVISIDGSAPAGIRFNRLKELAKKRWTSVGYLVRALERTFGKNFHLRIIDWKFCVGDAVKKGQLIEPADIIVPFHKHVSQLCFYQTMANLDYFGHCSNGGGVWENEGHFGSGQLVYLLPNSPQIVHGISISPSEQETTFIRKVVTRMNLAQQRAVIRGLSNFLIGNLVSMANDKDRRPALARKNREASLFEVNFVNEIISKYARVETVEDEIVKIPDEHDEIMTYAQLFLQQKFYGSAAEAYLKNERFLDVDLAFSHGAGFGDPAVINNLLDLCDYEQLVYYGFFNFSTYLDPTKGISPLLIRRGLKPERIGQEVKSRSGDTEYAYPDFPLRNRVTFPLRLGGKLSNFYGRATWACDKRYYHRKLSTDKTGLPHGGFNMEALQSEHNEVILVEGVMDGQTIIQIGFEPTIPLVGVNNVAIIKEVARSGKNVAIGLDNDKTGQAQTIVLTERLQRAGSKGKIRDFTEDFIKEHPEAANYKDFNKWWQDFGRFNH